jgi:hypothetical protein
MAWIESHQSLSRHRKTLEVVMMLHVDRHKLIGHLHELWWWGLDNADAEGQLGHVPPRALANAAGWPARDAQRFADALVTAGFIDRTDAGDYVLHDWFDYAGKLAEQRALRRESNRKAQSARRQRIRQHAVSADVSKSQQSTGPDQPDRTGDAAAAVNSPAVSRARARGSAGFEPMSALVEEQRQQRRQFEDLPEEVRERLARPPIHAHD